MPNKEKAPEPKKAPEKKAPVFDYRPGHPGNQVNDSRRVDSIIAAGRGEIARSETSPAARVREQPSAGTNGMHCGVLKKDSNGKDKIYYH